MVKPIYQDHSLPEWSFERVKKGLDIVIHDALWICIEVIRERRGSKQFGDRANEEAKYKCSRHHCAWEA